MVDNALFLWNKCIGSTNCNMPLVTGMPDFIGPQEKVQDAGVDKAVGVGEDAYVEHGAKVGKMEY